MFDTRLVCVCWAAPSLQGRAAATRAEAPPDARTGRVTRQPMPGLLPPACQVLIQLQLKRHCRHGPGTALTPERPAKRPSLQLLGAVRHTIQG